MSTNKHAAIRSRVNLWQVFRWLGDHRYCSFDLQALPASKFYKFVAVTPGNHLNRWLEK